MAGRPLKVGLDLGVTKFFSDNQSNMNATLLADTSVQFPISSAHNTDTFGSAGVSADYKLTNYASIYAKYEANTMNNNNSLSNNATVELKASF